MNVCNLYIHTKLVSVFSFKLSINEFDEIV